MSIFKFLNRGVATEGSYQVDAAFFENAFQLERIATDVVLSQKVDTVFQITPLLVVATDKVFEQTVVCNVVTGRLRYTAISFAGEPEDIDTVADLFLHGNTGHNRGFDIGHQHPKKCLYFRFPQGVSRFTITFW